MRSFLTLRLEEETPEAPETLETPQTSAARKPRKPRTKSGPLPSLDEVRRVLQENNGAINPTLHKALSVSRHTFMKLCAELEMPAPPPDYRLVRIHVPRECLEELIALKMSRCQMARALGLSNRGVTSLLARYGLKPFDPQEENRRLTGQGLRRCSVCQQIKLLEANFYFARSCAGGRSTRCKACSAGASKTSLAKKRAAMAKAADPVPPVAATSDL